MSFPVKNCLAVAVATYGSFRIAKAIGNAIQKKYAPVNASTHKKVTYPKVINVASGLIGAATGLFLANYLGLISVRSLATKALSYLNPAQSKQDSLVEQTSDSLKKIANAIKNQSSIKFGDE